MNLRLVCLVLLFIVYRVQAQITPPYVNMFNTQADTVGWTHYALSGTDNWEWGVPSGNLLDDCSSSPNAWGTNLDGYFTINSIMVLQSPVFDLSGPSNYLLKFVHSRDLSGTSGCVVEYSINNGPWTLLNGTNPNKSNWVNSFSSYLGQTAWQFSVPAHTYSAHSLNFLNGNSNVRFRFKLGGNSSLREGWVIDDFQIIQNVPNLIAEQGDTMMVSKYTPNIEVKSTIHYPILPTVSFNNTTNYYFSLDNVYDVSDVFLGSKTSSFQGMQTPWDHTLSMVPGLNAGYYYILYSHDVNNTLTESDENDNSSFAVLHVDTTFELPARFNFDSGFQYWTPNDNTWQHGVGNYNFADGAHSDSTAIGTYLDYTNHYVESPFINFTTAANPILNYWYNAISEEIYVSENFSLGWNTLNTLTPPNPENEWQFINIPLTSVSAMVMGKMRMHCGKCVLDDIYMGDPAADLSLDGDKTNRFTPSQFSTDTLWYQLVNCGLVDAPLSQTRFYWSNDTILDGSDILLGINAFDSLSAETKTMRSFTYSKPTAAPGVYYIIYQLDVTNTVTEMREYNNQGYLILHQQTAEMVPYENDFETQITGWRHNSSLNYDEWKWTVPNKPILDTAISGVKAWITNDTGITSNMSRMHLYTPVFDLTNVTNPVLEFGAKLTSSTTYAGANISYSSDGGATWKLLDTVNQSYKCLYYHNYYDAYSGMDVVNYTPHSTDGLFIDSENCFTFIDNYDSRNANYNYKFILHIPHLASEKSVQFRFNFGNSGAISGGLMIDDFSIREAHTDLFVKHQKSLMISSNYEKIRFFMDVENSGNYISMPSAIKYYVSVDTLIDSSDSLLGVELIPAIRPDRRYYINTFFESPINLGQFNYLIYDIDTANATPETNETNNIGYWALGLDSVSQFPYVQDFNDAVVNGWTHYVYHPLSGNHLKDQWRFRNQFPLNYDQGFFAFNYFVPGQMATEPVNPTMDYYELPVYYLESPSFNFTNTNNLMLRFDLFCTGIWNIEGGNLSYTTDGGYTWNLLDENTGATLNWYNSQYLSVFNNEPGWYEPSWGGFPPLTNRSIDISVLSGEPHVTFRFKHQGKAGAAAHGMRLDNFKIIGFNFDYEANDLWIPVNAYIVSPTFNINYSITNTGDSITGNTVTRFYWSLDSIYQPSDLMIHSVNEGPLLPGNTISGSTIINYPQPILDSVYYLFYNADGDSVIYETNEINNVGVFKIRFLDYDGINDLSDVAAVIYHYGDNLYVRLPAQFGDSGFTIDLFDAQGKRVYHMQTELITGLNSISLPSDMRMGVYQVLLQNDISRLSEKITLVR